jgi:hypothetical protein
MNAVTKIKTKNHLRKHQRSNVMIIAPLMFHYKFD